MGDPCAHGLAGWLRNFELHRALRLLLQHDGPRCHILTVADIPDPQLHQIARPQFAVDGEIKQCEFPPTIRELQANSNCPYLFQFERGLLADELALVQGSR